MQGYDHHSFFDSIVYTFEGDKEDSILNQTKYD